MNLLYVFLDYWMNALLHCEINKWDIEEPLDIKNNFGLNLFILNIL